MTNEKLKAVIKSIITPSLWQVVVCFLLSLALMLALYGDTTLELLSKSSHTNNSSVSSSFVGYLTAFAALPFTGNVFIILFWGMLALLVYIVGLAIANVLIDLRNAVVINTEFTKPSAVKSEFNPILARFFAILTLVVVLIICGWLIVPWLIQLVGAVLLTGFALSTLLPGIFAICGTALVFYLIWSLLQVVFVMVKI